jgi:hypothetical protein
MARIDIGGIHIIRKLCLNLGEENQIFSNITVLRIVSDSLEDFLDNHSGNEDVLSTAEVILQKSILPRSYTPEEIDPSRGVN